MFVNLISTQFAKHPQMSVRIFDIKTAANVFSKPTFYQ